MFHIFHKKPKSINPNTISKEEYLKRMVIFPLPFASKQGSYKIENTYGQTYGYGIQLDDGIVPIYRHVKYRLRRDVTIIEAFQAACKNTRKKPVHSFEKDGYTAYSFYTKKELENPHINTDLGGAVWQSLMMEEMIKEDTVYYIMKNGTVYTCPVTPEAFQTAPADRLNQTRYVDFVWEENHQRFPAETYEDYLKIKEIQRIADEMFGHDNIVQLYLEKNPYDIGIHTIITSVPHIQAAMDLDPHNAYWNGRTAKQVMDDCMTIAEEYRKLEAVLPPEHYLVWDTPREWTLPGICNPPMEKAKKNKKTDRKP